MARRSDFPVQAGRWRIVIAHADGGRFQWREPYFSEQDARDALARANAEYPTEDGHSAAVVEELRADGVGDAASAAAWFETKEA
jgi:hypothetical protein